MGEGLVLRMPAAIHAGMIDHARREAPLECVGLLAGSPCGLVQRRYELINELRSPLRFLSEPRSLLAAEKQRRAEGLAFLAVYHSHPTSRPVPSRYDHADHWCPQVACVIVSLVSDPPEVAAWWLEGGIARPARIELLAP
jgi:proteasome lid subunit RPN8/RPN11